jgi:DtxR family transcriptional regulator, Mn-dependent transcriptional regulator
MTLSFAMQEYLAEAYRLAHYQKDDLFVSTSALAQVMGVSAPAVTRMVQRLRDSGHLEHEPYQGIRLTSSGEREALLNIRRHRLVERFLVDVMGFGWHEVHDAADQLGESVGDRVVDRMDEMVGFPKRCPHGEPIPSADGVMPVVVDYPLTEATIQKDYVISRANSHDEDKLQYLDTLGLRPGVKIYLSERAPFEGPLQIQLDGERHFIGYAIAQVIRVCDEAEFELIY